MKYIVSYEVEAENPYDAVMKADFAPPLIVEVLEPPLKSTHFRIDEMGNAYPLCEGDK